MNINRIALYCMQSGQFLRCTFKKHFQGAPLKIFLRCTLKICLRCTFKKVLKVYLLKKISVFFLFSCETKKKDDSDVLARVSGKTLTIKKAQKLNPGKPLNKEIWAGAIDTLGSYTLANICSSTKYGGVIAACGLAQGFNFPSTVMPFILRGVTLVGIDSVYCPYKIRENALDEANNIISHKISEFKSEKGVITPEVIKSAIQEASGRLKI